MEIKGKVFTKGQKQGGRWEAKRENTHCGGGNILSVLSLSFPQTVYLRPQWLWCSSFSPLHKQVHSVKESQWFCMLVGYMCAFIVTLCGKGIIFNLRAGSNIRRSRTQTFLELFISAQAEMSLWGLCYITLHISFFVFLLCIRAETGEFIRIQLNVLSLEAFKSKGSLVERGRKHNRVRICLPSNQRPHTWEPPSISPQLTASNGCNDWPFKATQTLWFTVLLVNECMQTLWTERKKMIMTSAASVKLAAFYITPFFFSFSLHVDELDLPQVRTPNAPCIWRRKHLRAAEQHIRNSRETLKCCF